MPITALPTPPSKQDPTNFNDRADAFLGALPLFQTEANALQVSVNTSETNAVASSNAATAATNIVKWVSGTTYASGAVVWSPINGLGYRRITASGSGTTDPSLDTTNYKQINGTGDVSTASDQNIAGVKIFTGALRETKITMAASNIDVASGNIFSKTISGATTLTVSNIPASGVTCNFILDLINGGSATITWWSGVKWASGLAPILTISGRDVLGFFTHDGGTTWTGLVLGRDLK